MREQIAKVGLVPFEAVWDNGFRQITSSTHPIRTPEDLANFKIRVPVVPLWVNMFSALGAAPVSIPLNEAYSALQTRIADGQENPLALIEAAGNRQKLDAVVADYTHARPRSSTAEVIEALSSAYCRAVSATPLPEANTGAKIAEFSQQVAVALSQGHTTAQR